MKIAIQGVKGSFHDQAAQKIFGNEDLDLVECQNFRQVFDEVNSENAEYGLVAIENNLHGSINEVYRLLQKNQVWIVKDLRMHISQNLIAHKELSLHELQKADDLKVLSHPVALAQADNWLSNNLPNCIRESYSDTAVSVKRVIELGQDNVVAIASPFAAETYNAFIVQEDIHDDPKNFTRFVLFQKQKIDNLEATHSSLILVTDHKPGALLRCLEVFDQFNCNLVKLDSQPIPGDDQHYSFYIDYELNKDNLQLLNELSKNGCTFKVLGEYDSVK